jgi:hypothetical protein
LHQDYPNPFNPTTRTAFDLPVTGRAKLVVFVIVGREVAVLIDEVQAPGYKAVTSDSSRLASGVYFHRFVAGVNVETEKMIVAR